MARSLAVSGVGGRTSAGFAAAFLSVALATGWVVATAASAAAQETSGPLADPTIVPPKAASAAPARVKAARKNTHAAGHKHDKAAAAAAPRAPAEAAATSPDRNIPVSSANRRVNAEATDPITFGMKWNGANDTGEKTRVQNYDGNAEGTGAEVGLKLHF